MRDRVTMLLALVAGLALAALPFWHYRFGAAHHRADDHSRTAGTVVSEHSHHH